VAKCHKSILKRKLEVAFQVRRAAFFSSKDHTKRLSRQKHAKNRKEKALTTCK
jgi:hypothetical protein